MGIGLDATPSQVSLLFTGCLPVTAVAMLVVGRVSSVLGAKRTLVAGLAIIVLFAASAGLSGSIDGIVGFRAGWDLGNALFIATGNAAEIADAARATVQAHLDRLAARGMAADGRILTSVGDHAAAGRALARHAAAMDAQLVAVGKSFRGALVQFADGSLTTALTRDAACTVVLLEPGRAPLPLTEDAFAELRAG